MTDLILMAAVLGALVGAAGIALLFFGATQPQVIAPCAVTVLSATTGVLILVRDAERRVK